MVDIVILIDCRTHHGAQEGLLNLCTTCSHSPVFLIRCLRLLYSNIYEFSHRYGLVKMIIPVSTYSAGDVNTWRLGVHENSRDPVPDSTAVSVPASDTSDIRPSWDFSLQHDLKCEGIWFVDGSDILVKLVLGNCNSCGITW